MRFDIHNLIEYFVCINTNIYHNVYVPHNYVHIVVIPAPIFSSGRTQYGCTIFCHMYIYIFRRILLNTYITIYK